MMNMGPPANWALKYMISWQIEKGSGQARPHHVIPVCQNDIQADTGLPLRSIGQPASGRRAPPPSNPVQGGAGAGSTHSGKHVRCLASANVGPVDLFHMLKQIEPDLIEIGDRAALVKCSP